MGAESLKQKIDEQRKVYQALKQGDASTVCYKEFQNGSWGTDDENYTNRLRLSYYLLYNRIDDESAVVYLFEEELKDRENNSFQGIGNTILVLTQLLRKYNTNQKYAELFKRAKNANFDCACGYDADYRMDDEFGNNSLLDCIYLAQDMKYKDVMGNLADEWKKEITAWNISNRRTLIRFHTFLGRDAENIELYKKQLEEVMLTGKVSDIISEYRDLIQCCLRMGHYGEASRYCKTVIETTDYIQIRRRRLFGDLLEACFEITAHDPDRSADLWKWAKEEMQNGSLSRYGNLYTKGIAAAKVVHDPYADELEQEYLQWERSVKIG